jgi:hypothetical protein
MAQKASLLLNNSEPQTVDLPWQNPKTGLDYQAVSAMQCLREGKTQLDVIPLAESLEIMQTMDKIRKQWNFKYPFE